jgi:hypothetical protein
MTLVLSEVSKFGVVMVGDSAIESSYNTTDRLPSGSAAPPIYRSGCDKVKLVPHHPIGISFWGMGKIGDVPTDMWLDDYVRNIVKPEDKFADICEQLKERVNHDMTLSGNHGRGGFHVGTVMQPDNGPSIPAIYHIHNDNGDGEWIAFAVQEDIPFGLGISVDHYLAELDRGIWRFLRNGYTESFARLQNSIFTAIDELARTRGILVPYPEDMISHEKFARLQVGLFCDLFALSNQPPAVGRPITSLTIDLQGKTTYTSALSDLTHL